MLFLFSLTSFFSSLPGNTELEHQKEMTAEYESFYINSSLNTQVSLHVSWLWTHTDTNANAHRRTVNTYTFPCG